LHGDTHSFVVRIWHEALDGEGKIAAWRGSIDHVGHDARFHFDDLDQLARFIQKQVGLNSRRSPAPATSDANASPERS